MCQHVKWTVNVLVKIFMRNNAYNRYISQHICISLVTHFTSLVITLLFQEILQAIRNGHFFVDYYIHSIPKVYITTDSEDWRIAHDNT